MRMSISLVLAALTGLLAAGCKERTTVESASGKQLTLTAPSDVAIARGGTVDVKIHIGRKEFTGPVLVEFAHLPEGVAIAGSGSGGVTVDAGPVHVDVGKGVDKGPRKIEGDEAVYTLKASDNAVFVKDHEATVTAKGPEDLTVSKTLKITVRDKE
jgi:hypothetical protein